MESIQVITFENLTDVRFALLLPNLILKEGVWVRCTIQFKVLHVFPFDAAYQKRSPFNVRQSSLSSSALGSLAKR